MTDIYHRHADAVAEALLADSDLFADLLTDAARSAGGSDTPVDLGGVTGATTIAPAPASPPARGRRPARRTLMAAVVVVAVSAAAVIASWPRDGAPSAVPAAASPPASPASPEVAPSGVETPAPPGATDAPADAGGDPPVVLASATARCQPGSTDPVAAFDDDPSTAWVCFPAYGVPGTVLRVRFDGPYLVTELSMVPGWDVVDPDGTDRWTRHRTVGVVEYQFDDPDETRLRQEMAGYRGEVVTPVSPPVLAESMTVTIAGFGASADPSAAPPDDFAIPTITISGRRP